MIDFLKDILKIKEYDLHNYLVNELKNFGYEVIECEDYIYANLISDEIKYPVCVIAHLDTVWPLPPVENDFIWDAEKGILTGYGIGADDRCGVYAILTILNSNLKPAGIIFTHNEEMGGGGAFSLMEDFYTPLYNYKFLIELDRQGTRDCVFYSCDNKEFEEYLHRFRWETNKGSFSDISIIMKQWRIAAANLSIGYIDEHMETERVFVYELDRMIIPRIIATISGSYYCKTFRYIEQKDTDGYNFKRINISNELLGDTDKCYYCARELDKTQSYMQEKINGYYFICMNCKIKHHPDRHYTNLNF